MLGMLLGPVGAVLFGSAGGLMYYGTLAEIRQTYRLKQAEAIMNSIGTIVSIIEGKGRDLEEALRQAVEYGSPVGQIIMGDLYTNLRSESAETGRMQIIRKWARRWEHPAADILATVLIASYEKQIRLVTMLKNLGETMSGIIEILERARSQAKGVEWQAKFLAIFPPALVLMVSLISPELARTYASYPLFLLPVLLGSGLSYYLTTSTINKGLSLEASMGVQNSVELDKGEYSTRTHVGKLGEMTEIAATPDSREEIN